MSKDEKDQLNRLEASVSKLDEAVSLLLTEQKQVQELILELLQYYKKVLNFEVNFLKKGKS